MQHIVTDIQRFCMHDSPGIRTTVFLKGCPLRCFWCHNPETKHPAPQLMFREAKCIGCGACLTCENGVHTDADGARRIDLDKCAACGCCAELCPTGALSMAGKRMDSREILEVVRKDKAFYGKEGGLTVSGGEPMLHPEACIELLRLAKQEGLHTAVETCGFFPKEYLPQLCEVTDLFLWDVKDTDDARHSQNTGVSNAAILENLRRADSFGVPIVLRCVLLKNVNLNDEHLRKVGELYRSLRSAIRVDLLPCHSLGSSKAEAIAARVPDLRPYEPSNEEIAAANASMRLYAQPKQP